MSTRKEIDTDQLLKTLSQRGAEYEKSGDHRLALENYYALLGLIAVLEPESHIPLRRTFLESIGDVYQDSERPEEAFEHWVEALELDYPEGEEKTTLLVKISKACMDCEESWEALRFAKEALKRIPEDTPEKIMAAITASQAASMEYEDGGKDDPETYLRLALNTAKKLDSPDREFFCAMASDMWAGYLFQEDPERAKEYLTEAILLYSVKDEFRVEMLARLGDLNSVLEEYEESIEPYTQAIEILNELGPNEDDNERLIALYKRLGCAYHILAKEEQAVECFVQMFQFGPEVNDDVLFALEILEDFYLKKGDKKMAMQVAKQISEVKAYLE